MTMSPAALLRALAAVALLGSVGCVGAEDPEPTAAPRKARKASTVDESLLQEAPRTSDYSYNSIGKRDPFRSFFVEAGGDVDPDTGPRTPLQLFDIDQYKLTGVVWNVPQPRGMVQGPDGVGYVVEIGTLIGKNWGKVTQISPEEIVVTEEYRDPIENELIVNEIKMQLAKLDSVK